MAVTRYHSITYNSGLFHNGVASGVDMELLAPGDGASGIKSIMMTNTHATADATVSLLLQKDAAATGFYIISTIAIPSDTALLLDDKALLSFDNSALGFGLYLTVGSSDTIDILINV